LNCNEILKVFNKVKELTYYMKEELQTTIGKEGKEKRLVVEKVLNEVIGNDPLYGEIFKLLKNYYDELEENVKEKEYLKSLNEELNEKLIKLKRSLNELNTIHDSFKLTFKNLEKETL